jgi:hypothetical protein
MSFTDKNQNWTESEEAFYSTYSDELDAKFEEYLINLMYTSDIEGKQYYMSISVKMYWEFVDEQYSKFQDMVQAQLDNREYPDYNKFVVTL